VGGVLKLARWASETRYVFRYLMGNENPIFGSFGKKICYNGVVLFDEVEMAR
jgi:hypothetical protein